MGRSKLNIARNVVLFEAVESRRMLSHGGSGASRSGHDGLEHGVIETVHNSGHNGGNPTTTTSWEGNKSGDKMPLFDFTDAYYRQNGLDPTKLLARPNGTGGSVIDNRVNDSTRRNVRVKGVIGGHNHSGDPVLWSVFGVFSNNAFTNDSAGQRARTVANTYTFYAFPSKTGSPTSVAVKRQDDLIPTNNGYFSNDPLGMWRTAFVNYVPSAMTSGRGLQLTQDLMRKNGADLDGTPFIRTDGDLRDAIDAGIVTVTKLAEDGSQGPAWVLCPVYKDARGGAIQADATLAIVRNANGTAQASSRDIEQLFLSSIITTPTNNDLAL